MFIAGFFLLAFLVAWTGIAIQTAKLLGLLNLGLDLRRLGASKWELYLFWSLIGGSFGTPISRNKTHSFNLTCIELDQLLCSCLMPLVSAR